MNAKVYIFTRYLLILISTFTVIQCSKEQKKPIPPEIKEIEEPIVGSWELQYRVGFWSPSDTITPDSVGVDEYLTFMSNDTVKSERYYRQLDTTLLAYHAYEIAYWPFGQDTMLYIRDRPYYYFLSGDTLTIDDSYADGAYEFYLKLP